VFRLLLVTSCIAGCGRFGFDDEVMPDACAVQISAPSSRTNVHSYITFAATGGRPPYEFEVVAGPGAIDVDGKFASADQTGTATIEVKDAFGCTAQTTLEVGGTSMFYVGGTSMSVPTDQVLRSDDGITWTVVGNLPAARYSGALLVMKDTMFYVSGSGATVARDVYASEDGVTWIRIGDVPVGATSFGGVVWRGQLWMVGGNGNGRATRSSYDGKTWTDAGDLPEDNHGGSLAVLDDSLVYTGGHNGALYDWVVTSPDGDTWTDAANLPAGREYHRSITVGDTLVIVGGQTTTPTALALVTTTTDGTTFQTMPDLPTARANTGLAWFRDALWSVGGSDGNGVYSAPMGGSWTSHTTNFPAPRTSGGLVAFTPR
jgi:hypothetical protein